MSIENANLIDIIATDEKSGRVVLVMRESRAWDGSDLQLFELQEKLNAYLSFALDGEMAEAYPHLAAKPLQLRLDCAQPPDSRTQLFIEAVSRQIAFQDIEFVVRVIDAAASDFENDALQADATAVSCGEGCGCGKNR